MKKFKNPDGTARVVPKQDEHYVKCAHCGGSIWNTRYEFVEADGTSRSLRAPIHRGGTSCCRRSVVCWSDRWSPTWRARRGAAAFPK